LILKAFLAFGRGACEARPIRAVSLVRPESPFTADIRAARFGTGNRPSTR
jgi:hypothetical protein